MKNDELELITLRFKGVGPIEAFAVRTTKANYTPIAFISMIVEEYYPGTDLDNVLFTEISKGIFEDLIRHYPFGHKTFSESCWAFADDGKTRGASKVAVIKIEDVERFLI